ncbi:MAG: PfkB family carbohydrate kinase, partial [Gammaproteobacteria bacterium]
HVVDTTGAGDAFTGALAVALLENQAWQQAVAFAVAASELAVMAFGSQPGYASRKRLDAHLESTVRPLTPWGS